MTAQPVFAFTADGVAEALAALGGSADGVAEALAAGGWRGTPGSACRCPVAVYLAEVFPTAARVDVDHASVELDAGSGGALVVALPDPVVRFVAMFDQHGGRYAELDDGGGLRDG